MPVKPPSSLFISHGAPDLVLHDTAAKNFLEKAALSIGKPEAIIIVSAHFETGEPTIVADPAPGMIYDFGGFDPRLREMIYPAKGEPLLAERISDLFKRAGISHEVLKERGFDHGVWVPLSLLFRKADVPIVQLSVQPHLSTQHHYELGVALRSLVDDNVLVIGSGAITHNLEELFGSDGLLHQRNDKEAQWARDFADWMTQRIVDGDVTDIINYRENVPFAIKNHPTEEHFLPLMVALGASDEGRGWRLHESTEFAVLAMDAFAFS